MSQTHKDWKDACDKMFYDNNKHLYMLPLSYCRCGTNAERVLHLLSEEIDIECDCEPYV